MGFIGANGACKSTTIRILLGLIHQDVGAVNVLGHAMPADQAAAKLDIGFVSEDMRLYGPATLAWHMDFLRPSYPRWDQAYAESLLDRFDLKPQQKIKGLSHGQRVKAALLLALARRPRLLVLDEPVAMLDPLARHDFMALVLTAAADDGVSVLLSSHVLAELERVADYLIVLSRGRVQVAGEVDDLIASHRVLTGPAAEADRYTERPLVHARRADAQAHLLVRATADDPVPPRWEAHPVGLEELAMAYLREPGAGALPGPARGRALPLETGHPTEVTK